MDGATIMARLGLDIKGFTTGFATANQEALKNAKKLQETASGISADFKSAFAGGLIAGASAGAVAAIGSIIEEASHLHDTAQRFRVDSDALQTIGNAAREIDVLMETVARAMNLLEINSQKAARGNEA